MAAPTRIVFLTGILVVFIVGIVDFLTNFEKNGCEMTYMYEYPTYVKIELPSAASTKYPHYGLYIYAEGKYAAELSRSSDKLRGIPVLFIPGNAGSYKQVRSLGSVSYKKGVDSGAKFHFNFFSLDLNEELSALYGGVLQQQTEFAAYCIKHILKLYKGAPTPPKHVLVVGHSMGGIIARGLFTLPDRRFDKNSVHTILTQATPHQRPVLSLDNYIGDFYGRVNQYWVEKHNTTLKDVTVISTGGGYRDLLVKTDITSLANIVAANRSVSSNTMSVPRAYTSTDHLCHVWCKQIVMATTRALFDIVDRNTKQIAVNPNLRLGAFSHHLVDTPGSKQYKGAYSHSTTFDSKVKWSIRKVNPWNFQKSELNSTRYSVVELPVMSPYEYGYISISTIDNVDWLYTCATKAATAKMKPPQTLEQIQKAKKEKTKTGDDRCHTGQNWSPTAVMLPPYKSERRVVTLNREQLAENTHLVTVLPKSKLPQEVHGEIYFMNHRAIEYNITDLLTFVSRFPTSLMELDMVVKKTQKGALYYNITLRGLEVPLQAYEAYVTRISCEENSVMESVARLHVPWANEDVYSVFKPGQKGKISLKLQSGRPSDSTDWPSLHLYLNPHCTYKVSVAIGWTQLFGQFVRFYWAYIPAFLVIQLLMCLAYQLKKLDEEATVPSLAEAHACYAQPWRVVPLAIVFRFMLYFPEEQTLASKIYLPADDASSLVQSGSWYPALPIMLYLVSYSAFGLYSTFLTFMMAVAGRVTALIFKRCCVSVSVVNVTMLVQYFILFACLPVAYFMCGTLAIVAVYGIYFIKTLWTYGMAYHSGMKEKQIWNRHNMCLSITLLLLFTIILNGPSLIFWAQRVANHSELMLVNDPSKSTGFVIVVAALLLNYAQFPRISSELFGAMSSLVYFISVLMVVYCLSSVYRISYFISTIFLLISVPAALLRLTFSEKIAIHETEALEDEEEVVEDEAIPEPEMPSMLYQRDSTDDVITHSDDDITNDDDVTTDSDDEDSDEYLVEEVGDGNYVKSSETYADVHAAEGDKDDNMEQQENTTTRKRSSRQSKKNTD